LYWINQSQGLKGFEKKAAPIANFAEMRKNIQDKKLPMRCLLLYSPELG
jgi:hypothetical protein